MAITNPSDLASILSVIRTEIGKKDVPTIWLEFLLRVAASGSRGITTKQVAEEIGMNQGIASRMVKIMSRYQDAKSRKMEGYDVFVAVPDYEYRHRQRVFLSAKGKSLVQKLERYF